MTKDLNLSDFTFSWPYRVRYRDVDPQGVIYFPKYLEIANGIIHEYFRWLDFPYRLGADPIRGDDFHIVRSLVNYHAVVRFDEEIELGVRTCRLGRSSMTVEVGFFGGRGDLRATAEIVWVNTDQTTNKSVPLPEELVASVRARDVTMIDL